MSKVYNTTVERALLAKSTFYRHNMEEVARSRDPQPLPGQARFSVLVQEFLTYHGQTGETWRATLNRYPGRPQDNRIGCAFSDWLHQVWMQA